VIALHDIVVVGAGPVGATLALGLADSGLDVVVLDARQRGELARGDRSLALSHGARLILERLGVWSALAATPGAATAIDIIDISQARGFGAATLTAAEQGVPALGYVVSYRALQLSLDAALVERAVAVRHGAGVRAAGGAGAHAVVELDEAGAAPLRARLVAIADGTGAAVNGIARHRHDYRQVALVAKVFAATPHRGRAYERFTPEGPVALLPEADHYSLVWTATPARANELLALDESAFVAALARHCGSRICGFTGVGERKCFPLVLEFAPQPVAARCVALGNAAQTLHPVAGQGFNVGLRDAYELAAHVIDTPREALGDREMLRRYARSRRHDRLAGIAFTHGLVGVFSNDIALARWPRGLALALLDIVAPAKRAFTQAMMFGLR
jgi:2-octaprenyl-6-methoxyphenol hydroxylase